MKKKFWLWMSLFMVIVLCTSGGNIMASNLPEPADNDITKPSGNPGNLVVLDWAGFKSAVSYTFDDGQPSHIKHYDQLEAAGVDMTFYISSNIGGNANFDNAWKQAVEDGHEIGNHTASHPKADLSGSSFGSALSSPEKEIEVCSDYIIEHFGQEDVWTMAAPFGDYGWKEYAQEYFLLNRGVGGGTIGPDANKDQYNLPCYMASSGDTAEKFNDLIDSAYSDGEWLILLYHTIEPTNNNWYAPVDISEITASINHAKEYGDVWIDTMVDIGSYWVGQKMFESITPTETDDKIVWEWTLPDSFPSDRYLRVTVDGGKLMQNGKELKWDSHGYYQVSLDEKALTLIK